MNVRDALLAVLATVPLTACRAATDCDVGREEFVIDEALSPEQIDEIVTDYDLADHEAIPCETACREAYSEVEGWTAAGVDTCSLSLPSSPNGWGHVKCTGTGYDGSACPEGRRPLGHVEAGDESCASPLGRSLAAIAYLEAASVDAFEQLADALLGWGAPEQLVERCRAAAEDERHHARWFTALAAAYGARVPTPTRIDEVPTTRLAVAEHNAREGCVLETFAALIAGVRARRAPDPRLRRVFTRVAADEARHAQLAWDLDAWFRTQLSADANARVEAARAETFAQLPARARALARLPAELGTLDQPDAERLAQDLRTRLAA